MQNLQINRRRDTLEIMQINRRRETGETILVKRKRETMETVQINRGGEIMETLQTNRRGETRVDYPFTIRFRNVTYPALHGWDLSGVKNISKSGILFNASQPHKPGSELELKFPLLTNEIVFWANIGRCRSVGSESFYELSATLLFREEETRKTFHKTMDSLIEKKNNLSIRGYSILQNFISSIPLGLLPKN